MGIAWLRASLNGVTARSLTNDQIILPENISTWSRLVSEFLMYAGIEVLVLGQKLVTAIPFFTLHSPIIILRPVNVESTLPFQQRSAEKRARAQMQDAKNRQKGKAKGSQKGQGKPKSKVQGKFK